jgi:four helix bundle protein
MPAQFDHEKLRAYQEALRFVVWVGPIIETLPAKLSSRDQLDRASTSIALNIAEGNGKRSHPDGSALECAACLDVLVARAKFDATTAGAGKEILIGVVSLLAGLIARFSSVVSEDQQAPYGETDSSPAGEKEND